MNPIIKTNILNQEDSKKEDLLKAIIGKRVPKDMKITKDTVKFHLLMIKWTDTHHLEDWNTVQERNHSKEEETIEMKGLREYKEFNAIKK